MRCFKVFNLRFWFEGRHGQQVCAFVYMCTQICNLPLENTFTEIFQSAYKEKQTGSLALIQEGI